MTPFFVRGAFSCAAARISRICRNAVPLPRHTGRLSYLAPGLTSGDGEAPYVVAKIAQHRRALQLARSLKLDVRFAWRASERIELSLAGQNLLHAQHLEFPTAAGSEIERSIYGRVALRY